MAKIIVAGAGGMIGGFLTKRLLEDGHEVKAADVKPLKEWYQVHPDAWNISDLDLKDYGNCITACNNTDMVYQLAADMGGIGWITHQRVECSLSVLISANMLRAAEDCGVYRLFYSSSACVYPEYRQLDADVTALKESDAYPAEPEIGYGEEKLFSEGMCQFFHEEGRLQTRIARYHNIYSGSHTTFEGGREKAPAAICRKVAHAILSGEKHIDIWGDGEQTRSFAYIDDCVEGTIRLMESGYHKPLNIGSDRLVTINELVDIIEKIAGTKLERRYELGAPTGVRGRNSDNTLIKDVLGWEPSITLEYGLEKLLQWVYDEMKDRY